MKKSTLCLTLSLAISGVFSTQVLAETNIRVGHGAADTYHMHKAWVKFKELVEKESNNDITVDIYPNGQVGGDRELTEAVQSGIVDMTAPVVEVMAGWDPAFSVPGLPYTFSSREEALKALNGEFGHKLLAKVEDFGIKGLGWMENGIRNITSNKCPIKQPSDLNGVKIRTMQVEAHMDAFKAMGANPTPMSFNEVYSALQQGVVDAQENPLGHIYSSRFYEVQKCLTLSGHVYSTHMVLANPDFYAGLSDEDRALIDSALARAIDYQQEVIASEEQEQLAAIKAAGVTVTNLTPEEVAKFQEVTAPIREKYTKLVDPALIKALHN
ncbi:C4-dicarboxylate ABC transporter substrate-binding protein [Vibrio natriegens]|uniref:TRAP transporter substrate-binding protein n=1 Tax=Vibrio natriegens TaxID=691 RepID=UPI000804639B|nr:TRAP transporter substrate-binding protein [Vibrio natriegens]ANQ23806.1 C4-dicarboxylate ABC transporter substrate-binding protein [Vibrio natriegens]MCY9876960.1 TRAP transporter substrate-binding protein [Vibrio natriegens]